jgi:glycosyltransferase involved in cell wall biosynthesis
VRVVIVTPAAPHPFGETAARGLSVLIDGLLARGAHVRCLVAATESQARIAEARRWLEALPGARHLELEVFPLALRPVLRRQWRSLWRPFSETRYAHGLAAALARSEATGYDVLHLEQLWSGWLGLGRRRALLNVYQLEIVDWEGRRPDGWAERKARLQMRRATGRLLRGARHVRVVSPRLQTCARQINPHAEYTVVPFALDVSLYPLQPPAAEPVVGLLGSMHWLPSRSAAERLITRIWPRVRRRLPSARLVISGWNARRYLERLSGPDIEIVENLAHPSEFFSRVAVMAYAPARGTGMKVKVLESMAYGVPVVTTAEGAEGLAVEDDVHCEIREDDEGLAEAIVAQLSDDTRRGAMRQAARELVEARYSREPFLTQMVALYDRVARS